MQQWSCLALGNLGSGKWQLVSSWLKLFKTTSGFMVRHFWSLFSFDAHNKKMLQSLKRKDHFSVSKRCLSPKQESDKEPFSKKVNLTLLHFFRLSLWVQKFCSLFHLGKLNEAIFSVLCLLLLTCDNLIKANVPWRSSSVSRESCCVSATLRKWVWIPAIA